MTFTETRAASGRAAVAAAFATVMLAAAPAMAQEYPDPGETLDWTIAFGPGGGNDIMARTIVDILNTYDLYPGDIAVENRAGGSGAVGWGYLFNQSGSGYGISTTSGSFVTTPLQADTPWDPADFTPVALLATDDLVLVVNGSSPIQTIDEFIAYAQENPITIAGTGTVNVDFIVPTLFAQARASSSNTSRSTRWRTRRPRSCRARSTRWWATRARSSASSTAGTCARLSTRAPPPRPRWKACRRWAMSATTSVCRCRAA
jgi:hypothetical protein